MALNSYFSAGERLELSYLADTKDESVCLAVEGNSNVRQDSTNVIVWDCEASRGKTWELDHSQSHGSHFQIKYTGPTQESFDLCVAGQTPGGSRDFGEGSQFYLWRCMPNDPTQQFQFVGARHPSRTGGRAMSWPAWKSTSASGALSHFSAMTRPSWLSRAARNRHRHAIEQASRRWRGGRRCDSARPRRKILISTQVLALSYVVTGITGASVDMLSECKHSVTVKYWGGPRGWFFRLLFAALVLATLCGLRGGAELFWLVLLRGLSSLVVALFLGLFGGLVSLPIAVAGSSQEKWIMSIETGRRQFAEINVGAFAAAVFVFSRVFECGSVVELMLDDGSWVLGRIEKIHKGDEKRQTRYDIVLLDGGGYMRRVTATLPDGAARMRSTDGKPDFICSVLDTLDADMNKALCKSFRAKNLVREAFGNVDAGNQRDCWDRRPQGSKLLERLQDKVNGSFCKPDGLSKMLIEKLAAHQDLLEKLYRQSPLELAKPKAPPPGSRVAVRSSDGVDHDGTVVVALDQTRATVQFDDGTAGLTVDFPRHNVRVTRVGPADDAVEDEGSPDDAVPPFVVGQLVEADWNGQGVIYSGMIVEALADGTYKVKYDFDGEVSTEPPERISPVAQRSRTDAPSYVPPPDEDNATPPKGSRVTVLYARGQEYEGTVVDVLDAHSAVVQFDNNDIEEIDFSVGDYRITRWGPGEPSPDGIDDEERELIAQFDQNQRERPKSDYEIEKEEQVARNEAFLNSLGLGSGVATGARNGSGGEPARKRRRVSYASYAVDEDFQPEEEDVEMA